jgi:hypothetical protein
LNNVYGASMLGSRVLQGNIVNDIDIYLNSDGNRHADRFGNTLLATILDLKSFGVLDINVSTLMKNEYNISSKGNVDLVGFSNLLNEYNSIFRPSLNISGQFLPRTDVYLVLEGEQFASVFADAIFAIQHFINAAGSLTYSGNTSFYSDYNTNFVGNLNIGGYTNFDTDFLLNSRLSGDLSPFVDLFTNFGLNGFLGSDKDVWKKFLFVLNILQQERFNLNIVPSKTSNLLVVQNNLSNLNVVQNKNFDLNIARELRIEQ